MPYDVYRLKIPTLRKGTFGEVCVQVEEDSAARPPAAPIGRDSRGLRGGRGFNDTEAAYFNAMAESLRLMPSQLISIAA